MDIGVTPLSSMFMSTNTYFYLFERPSNMTLVDYVLNLDQPLSVDTIKRIAYDLLKSAQMLHAKGIVHLDITPGNILVVDSEGLCKSRK